MDGCSHLALVVEFLTAPLLEFPRPMQLLRWGANRFEAIY